MSLRPRVSVTAIVAMTSWAIVSTCIDGSLGMISLEVGDAEGKGTF